MYDLGGRAEVRNVVSRVVKVQEVVAGWMELVKVLQSGPQELR